MRKGLIFYVLSGICALSSIVTLSSCSSANADNSSIETSSLWSSINPNESKKEETIVTDYNNLDELMQSLKTDPDSVVGKTVTILYDDIDIPVGGIREFYQDSDYHFYCEIDMEKIPTPTSGDIFKFKVTEVRIPTPAIQFYSIVLRDLSEIQ